MANRAPVAIEGRPIDAESPPFIIAEVSANHSGDISRALDIIDAAADAGVDAVKFQTYTADTITLDVDSPAFRVSDDHGLWGGRILHDLYREAHTPWAWHEQLFDHARKRDLIAFSSPFDTSAVRLLEGLNAPAYKVASLEIGDLGLLRTIAATGKPVILSNGAATLAETVLAVDTLRDSGATQIVLLHCVSSYPASAAEADLRAMVTLRDALDVEVGFSDHTEGIGVSIAAVALGARVIEKHLTMSRADGGVDAAFSLEPAEFAILVTEAKNAWLSLGSAAPRISRGESESRRLRRSLWVTRDVVAGERVTEENVRSLRPAGGLEPLSWSQVEGREFRVAARRGTPLSWNLI